MADRVGNHSFLYRLAAWARCHLYLAMVLILGVAAVVIGAYHYVSDSLQQRVTLLTGPEGSFNKDIGETLHDQFLQEPAWHLWGRSFDFTALDTNGSQENRGRVEEDRNGRLLGVALDGFAQTPHVRTMLHLTDVPLLILARRDFLNDAAKYKTTESSSAAIPQTFTAKLLLPDSAVAIADVAINAPRTETAEPTFSQIASYINKSTKPCHCYLGASGSGTRSLAWQILDSYEVSPRDVDRLSQLTFTEAAAALEAGQLDVAFFLLPIGTDFIVNLLRHGDAHLVGLDQTSGFVSRNQFLTSKTLVAGAVAHDIPPQAIATVQARLVLICSDCMPKYDAYWLTRSIAGYLRQDESIGPSLANDLTPGTDGTTYEMHEGARMFHDQREPWYVNGSRNSIHWLLGALVLTPLAAYAPFFLARLLSGRPTPPGTAKNELVDSAQIEPRVAAGADLRAPDKLLPQAKQLCADIDNLPPQTTPAQLADVYNRFKDLDLATRSSKASSLSEQDSLDEARQALKEVKETLNHMGVIKTQTKEEPARQ